MPLHRRAASVLLVLAALALHACGDSPTDAPPRVATSATAASGDDQAGTVGAALPQPLVVKVLDQNGKAMAGVKVVWSTASGSLSADTLKTDASGQAQTTWTLGTEVGTQSAQARVGSLTPVTFDATASAGAAVAIQKQAGDGQTAQAGSTLPTPLAVRMSDAFGNPVPGVTVTWTVVSGGGSLAPTSATTGADGTATASWTLGTTAGTQTVRASSTGLTPATFSAVASAGAAASMAARAGNNQSAPVGTAVAVAPSVVVRDPYGNPVPGVPVTFAVTSGGGSVTGAGQVTNTQGAATVGSWTLGATEGTNTLTANVAGVGPVVFAATATAATVSQFHIEIRYVTTPTTRQQQAVDAAVARWREVITGDLQDIDMTGTTAECGNPAVTGVVDDLLIFVDFSEIDGAGGTLGQAGPCYYRPSGIPSPLLPITGQLRLDAVDLADMEADGTLDEVVLHEIGHVLGIGTFWDAHGLLAGADTTAASDSPYFTGAEARSGFGRTGGSVYTGNTVPVEGRPAPAGTRYAHWRESLFMNELMTGWISSVGNPLSEVTVGSLFDLGYQVDFGAADAFTYTGGTAGVAGLRVGAVELREAPSPRPVPFRPRR